ncbi:phosphoadenosine phosphosulfate reductase family protein [Micromonospora sp. NPDC049366]|uniref:phosphoadenosine phosphosulfate reductase domain-containing protein n=1 Tax=Micromonospora sp. NPDC049366 TaxID=3364271 RepID=UPI0037A09CF7
MRTRRPNPPGSLLFDLPTDDHRAPRATDPDLRDADRIVFNHSGGKDGLAALIVGVPRAASAGVLDRVVVQYNDLGRVVWPSTREADEALAAEGFEPWLVDRFGDRPGCRDLARLHARHFGVRFEVRSRAGLDLLDDIERRGKFPDAARRWCTSDFKRGPGQKLLTELTRELDLDRPARIVYVYGFRAEESTNRARKSPCAPNASASNLTRRHVVDWYPVHHWTEEQVWAEIRAEGVPWAWPYDAGMSRLSCSMCVLASKQDLLTAIRLRPGLARQYAAVEERIGHSFQQGRPMAALLAEAGVSR